MFVDTLLMSSQILFPAAVLIGLVQLQMTPSESPLVAPLWLLISPQGCSWAVPWSFLLLKWNSFSKTKLHLGPVPPTPMVQNTKAGNCCD